MALFRLDLGYQGILFHEQFGYFRSQKTKPRHQHQHPKPEHSGHTLAALAAQALDLVQVIIALKDLLQLEKKKVNGKHNRNLPPYGERASLNILK